MLTTAVLSAISASFFASFVEVVEAFTIVLAVGTVRGWRPALSGTFVGLAALAALVLILGPLISLAPLRAMQIAIGSLLLLFGMRWLRKAILRAAGILPLHDEEAAFNEERGLLRQDAETQASRADFLAAATAFKAVLLEGVEVVFIILAVGGGRGLILAASLGALVACAIVVAIGGIVHRPLARVPENALKFVVGALLSAFGTFWVTEGVGGAWLGEDLAIIGLAAGYGFAGIICIRLIRLRSTATEVAT